MRGAASFGLALLVAGALPAGAQEIELRAYANAPRATSTLAYQFAWGAS